MWVFTGSALDGPEKVSNPNFLPLLSASIYIDIGITHLFKFSPPPPRVFMFCKDDQNSGKTWE